MSKPWYASKTLWINGLTALAGALGVLATTTDTIKPFLDPQHAQLAAALLAAGIGLVNVGLRFITDSPIGSPEPASGQQ